MTNPTTRSKVEYIVSLTSASYLAWGSLPVIDRSGARRFSTVSAALEALQMYSIELCTSRMWAQIIRVDTFTDTKQTERDICITSSVPEKALVIGYCFKGDLSTARRDFDGVTVFKTVHATIAALKDALVGGTAFTWQSHRLMRVISETTSDTREVFTTLA